MNVTVFGGAQPQPGSPAYLEACELGRLLAQAGHAVLTGGYIGTMEAVSKGANEAGGHVIGVTCDEIEHWRGTSANRWVMEVRHFSTMQERLNELVRACDAAIATARRAGYIDRDLPFVEPDDRQFNAAQAAYPGRSGLEGCVRRDVPLA